MIQFLSDLAKSAFQFSLGVVAGVLANFAYDALKKIREKRRP